MPGQVAHHRLTTLQHFAAMFVFTFLVPFVLSTMAVAQQQSLIQLIESQPDLSTLLAAVKVSGRYLECLQTAGGITVLAPTNEAFDCVPEDSPVKKAVAAVESGNVPEGVKEGLSALLAYHTLQGAHPSSSLQALQFVPSWMDSTWTVEGKPQTNVTGGQNVGVSKTGSAVQIESGLLAMCNVVQADIMAPNDIVIHKIDQVLTLPANFTTSCLATGNTALIEGVEPLGLEATLDTEADLTVFIPSNDAIAPAASLIASASNDLKKKIFLYHTVAGQVIFSNEFKTGTTLPTQDPPNEITVTVTDSGGVMVDQSNVVTPNIILYNGVGHVIDRILKPADFVAMQQGQQGHQ